ncbi:SDR family NAD(P)-dependent oxidoreductase [Paenibacillus eucommiae]|uniref:NAD(P)-dependent dehydrogenase (Short-subunit alcohol dehydrogenase family) n=1 Tax=Paenibacillus eucommiae TaxID=1355755 RepID=A0ABS4J2F9_9BACL|nr:SDR family NAD(P)-dependent oxidoreductase [Paenibacillus eucommiae]MBP1994029.1 NAD(P)-dependent dehydrogenase (short-subunit alcohol dehydrogenase family) [Paenibacillus eucommiae]
MERFAGKTVVITGGATGIGFAAAQLFASSGAHVVLAGRNSANGEAAQQALREKGGEHLFVQADVSKEEDVKRLMQQAAAHNGRIDILVNNAAMFYESDFLTETSEQWRRVFNVIADGAYLCTKYAAEVMVANGHPGAIVNISSINGYRALNKSSHYNAAKGALDQLTRCTALELAPYGIRVNGVAPGFIDTGLSVIGGVNELETEDFLHYYIGQRKIPLARAGLPQEIATIIAFLASEESSYIQGATIPADGGLSITF